MPGASRWANDEADAAEDARRKKEKEEKKRAKLLKQQQQQQAEEQAKRQQDEESRPAKRRRLSAEAEQQEKDKGPPPERKLLRLDGGTWSPCRHISNFETLNDIAEGSYGFVSRAKESTTGQIVALKKVKMDYNQDGFPITALREVTILQKAKHQNIVDLREVVMGSNLDEVLLVMEFLEHDLKTLQEDMPEPFLASEVKTLIRQLASAVDFLHTNHILHRDLKTSNILLSNRGTLKIADFGMSRHSPPSPSAPLTQLVVTLWYRAPELLLGTESYSSEIDIWSLGCIFGELLQKTTLLAGKNEVDQLSLIFALVGLPTEKSWPDFWRLPNAKSLKLPRSSSLQQPSPASLIRQKYPFLTSAGANLLSSLLALNPQHRPTAKEILEHPYFKEAPKPKPPEMFPTFPSKAGQERRRKRSPNAPKRGEAPGLGAQDFSGIFAGREDEQRGAGFSLRMA